MTTLSELTLTQRYSSVAAEANSLTANNRSIVVNAASSGGSTAQNALNATNVAAAASNRQHTIWLPQFNSLLFIVVTGVRFAAIMRRRLIALHSFLSHCLCAHTKCHSTARLLVTFQTTFAGSQRRQGAVAGQGCRQ